MIVGFARKFCCDWPECMSAATIESPDQAPAGWVLLPDNGFNFDGRMRRDFCAIHAQVTMIQLAEKIKAKP